MTQVRFPGAARDFFFLPESTFSADSLSYGVRTPPCAIACINICAHVRDLVVHVRVRWIMEIPQHPACTVGWVARLCRNWRCPGKAARISRGRNPNGRVQSLKKRKKSVPSNNYMRFDGLCFVLTVVVGCALNIRSQSLIKQWDRSRSGPFLLNVCVWNSPNVRSDKHEILQKIS